VYLIVEERQKLIKRIQRSTTSFLRTNNKKKSFKSTWEKQKEWATEVNRAKRQLIKEMKRERGIVKGRVITVLHNGKPWAKKIRSTTGKIIQVTDHFFAVRNSSGFCECFLFTDVMYGIITIKEELIKIKKRRNF
jgi:hypothetical protein